MSLDNSRVNGTEGYCLATADKKQFVFFVEDTDWVTIDLSGMLGNQPVMVVDANVGYKEIEKGYLTAGVHTIKLGSSSDWVIAIGRFELR